MEAIFGPILLVLMLLVFFGMIAGVKADRIVSTYLNLLVQLIVVIGEVLTKLAIPIIKQLGEKIVYTANHYLAEHQKQNPKIAQEKPTDSQSLSTPNSESKAEPPQPKQPQEPKQPKTSSANPYDDPPEPEIMD